MFSLWKELNWVAFEDGCEEDGNYGYGETPEAALADWHENRTRL